MIDPWELEQKQKFPLEMKVRLSKEKIRDWILHWKGNVYVSFSGGKDSTVLLDLVRSIYPDVPAVFMDTGLEYPEIREVINNTPNLIRLRPKIPFTEVLKKYGYPVISKENAQKLHEIRTTKSEKLLNKRLHGDEKGNGKLPKKWQFMIDAPFKVSHKCCHIMKKNPVKSFEKKHGLKPFVGTMAAESSLRKISYLKTGCNAFDSKRPMSLPMSFWLEKDVWEYIKTRDLPYSKIYDMGYKQTGCVFCCFGVHLEDPNKFQLLKKTHPKLHKYCMEYLGIKKVLDFLNVPSS